MGCWGVVSLCDCVCGFGVVGVMGWLGGWGWEGVGRGGSVRQRRSCTRLFVTYDKTHNVHPTWLKKGTPVLRKKVQLAWNAGLSLLLPNRATSRLGRQVGFREAEKSPVVRRKYESPIAGEMRNPVGRRA